MNTNNIGALSITILALGLLGAFGILLLPGYLCFRLIRWFIED